MFQEVTTWDSETIIQVIEVATDILVQPFSQVFFHVLVSKLAHGPQKLDEGPGKLNCHFNRFFTQGSSTFCNEASNPYFSLTASKSIALVSWHQAFSSMLSQTPWTKSLFKYSSMSMPVNSSRADRNRLISAARARSNKTLEGFLSKTWCLKCFYSGCLANHFFNLNLRVVAIQRYMLVKFVCLYN